MPDARPEGADSGSILSDAQSRFLGLLANHWETHPEYAGYTLDFYLTAVFRVIYLVPEPDLKLVGEELLAQRRHYKPTADCVRRLCLAAMMMRQAMYTLGFRLDPPVEPDLRRRRQKRARTSEPKPPKRGGRRRVRL
jgi:hypothetical protein